MEEKREVGVSPARMACLMEVAGKVAKQMTRKNEQLQAEAESGKE